MAVRFVGLAELAFVFGISLSVCGCSQNLLNDASLESPDESILVLGVDQENSYVALRPGTVRENGVFRETPWTGGFMTKPANGFVVAKVRGGDTWGLVTVMFKRGTYRPCLLGDNLVRGMTFDIPKGKVVYLGHIDYEVDGYDLTVKHRWDLDSAKKYIDENHPRLRGRLEAWDPKLRWVALTCVAPQYRMLVPAFRDH